MENKYPIPVYLHHEIVFDILATMQDGFTAIRSLKTVSKEQQERSSGMEGELGVSNIFSLLNVKLSGKMQKKSADDQTTEESVERVHTPSSLFVKMREKLREDNLLHPLDTKRVQPGQFVEFNIQLRRNPLVDTFNSLSSVIKMLKLFNKEMYEAGEMPKIDEIVIGLVKDLTEGGIVDLFGISALSDTEKIQVVLTVKEIFARDQALSDMTDGDYSVLGKVIRVVRENDEPINLLRKSSFGALSPEKLDELMGGMQTALVAMSQQGLRSPKLIFRLESPAVHILPIAIFS